MAVPIRNDLAPVEVIRHAVVELSDGCRLGARIWLPDGARERPVPAVLEFLPYRKNEGTAVGDHRQMTYLAAHGIAGVRIDQRGSGDSDGVLEDEYLSREQDDAVETIAWIAAQPWCSGAVGMTGGSWGGVNSLQVAARRPPALKAIAAFSASDDRYADDVHYRGGCVLAMDMLQWATCMLAFNAKPPDPANVGAEWRGRWLRPPGGAAPLILPGPGHPPRGPHPRARPAGGGDAAPPGPGRAV